MTTLTISTMENGFETQIGKVVFDESKNARLTTEKGGPEAERLQRVWEEISRRKSLPMQWTEKKKVEGDLITARKSKEVSKDDDDYPSAVWSYLESQHGYLIDQETSPD